MLLTIRQVQSLIAPFNILSSNPEVQVQDNRPVQIMASPQVNYLIIPIEGNINPGEPQVIKLYVQTTQEIEK